MTSRENKMSLKTNMQKWLESANPKLAEWIPVFQKLTDDTGVFATCLRFAERYENKEIDNQEFLVSVSNITHKSLEEIEQALKSTAEEKK
jgi:hypothetical protein